MCSLYILLFSLVLLFTLTSHDSYVLLEHLLPVQRGEVLRLCSLAVVLRCSAVQCGADREREEEGSEVRIEGRTEGKMKRCRDI
jgi:hypothetical protein